MSTPRVSRLKDRLARLEHDCFREYRPLSVAPGESEPREPIVVRKARGLALMLKEMPVYIQDDELIVGGRTLYGDPDRRVTSKRQYLFKQLSRWPVYYYPRYLAPDEVGDCAEAPQTATHACEGAASGHAVVGFQKVLTLGFGGMRAEARCAAERLRAENPLDLPRRLAFLEAAEIVLRAASDFIRRYAD
nr:hypothetical protein [Dehalococcoidales bacterium]